jgi:hypothetical protein
MGNQGSPNLPLKYNPAGKRNAGRPQRRWKDNFYLIRT